MRIIKPLYRISLFIILIYNLYNSSFGLTLNNYRIENQEKKDTGELLESSLLQEPSRKIFMKYLKSNWDDIHDVIMRYHCDNPDLRGTVEIEMEWINGKLTGALVQSNTTGNAAFGQSLIHAMQDWSIQGLPAKWNIVVPFKTQIYGSKKPNFKDCGIFTGKVIYFNGLPVKKARIILNPVLNVEAKADTLYTNREGIFIKTLLKPGTWEIICQTPEGEYIKEFQINILAGEHIQKMIKIDE